MIYRKTTLFDQGLNCITMLVLGMSTTSFIPRDIQSKLFPYLIVILLLELLVSFYHQAKHGKEGIKREQRDERSQMILDKAVWYCRQAEDWIFLGLFAVFSLFLHKYEIAYTLLWVMIGRNFLTFGIRWWLNRKY